MSAPRPRLQSWLWLLQRLSALVLVAGVGIHFTTNILAIQGGLSAQEIIERTSGNQVFFAFYVVFSLAISIHGAIGLRTILRETLPRLDGPVNFLALVVGLGLAAAGIFVAYGLYSVTVP